MTSRAAWGAGAVSLRARVGCGVSAGRRLALGVDGGGVVEEKERGRGSSKVSLGLLLFSSMLSR
jgi:hypothetical protein